MRKHNGSQRPVKCVLTFALLVAVAFTATPFAHAAVWYVNAASTAAAPDGQSWATAYPAIQSAVDAAASGDEVWVAAGTYTGTGDYRDYARVVNLKAGVTLYGGFSGTETAREQRDWKSNTTVIDGQQARQCVYAHGATSAVDGLTLRNGISYYGGGMSGGSATNCTFASNRAMSNYYYIEDYCHYYAGEGGGLCGGTATDCTFSGNYAALLGGGAYNSSVVNCILSSNFGGSGGGSCQGTAANCTFAGNSAYVGGGMCQGTATNCTITGNSAEESGGMDNGTAVNCIIWGNEPSEKRGTTVSHSCLSTVVAGTGNIVSNPRFVNPWAGDFRLRADSPCVDTGTAEGAPAADLLGRPRPQGAGVDMGAYDYYAGDDTGAVDVPPVLRVSAASTAATPDGLTWETAFSTLQAAADRSGYGGEIWVAEGTYTAAAGNEVVKLLPGTSLFGGFAGTETAREPRDWVTHPTVIDGQGARRGVSANGAASVDGCTARNGAADYGAGMYGGTATHCSFIGNAASDSRGKGTGGGMHYGTAVDCTFTGNSASYGGGMDRGTTMNCTFTGNTAKYHGGGIYGGTANNGAFTRNSASYGGGMDGGTAVDCTFTGNSASYGGGMDGGTAMNCTFTGNTATDYSGGGGGMYRGMAVNCAFTGNTAAWDGGGMYFGTATNCTFTGNSGGGMYEGTATNCVLFGNTPYETKSRSTNVSHSCLSKATSGTGNIVGDPLFVNAAAGDFRLQPGSPCIDTGTADGAPATDILGVPRPQGAGVDMGAYEILPVSVPDVIGLARSAAHELIAAARLYVRTETEQYHPTVPVNHVISQSPAAGTQTITNTPVDLVISKGPQPVPVPDVVGQTQAAAVAAIAGAGCVVGNVAQAYSATVPAGSVILQCPPAGTEVLPGTPVDLVISRGIQPSLMPDMAGMTREQAGTAVAGAGLLLGLVTQAYSNAVAAGNIISQSPEAGTSLPQGTVVSIVVSLGPVPTVEGEGPPVDADTARGELASAFTTADTDGDGKLFFAEAAAALPGLTQATFDELDTDGDGKLTQDELAAEDGGGCAAGCRGDKSLFQPPDYGKGLGDLFLMALGVMGLAIMDPTRRL